MTPRLRRLSLLLLVAAAARAGDSRPPSAACDALPAPLDARATPVELAAARRSVERCLEASRRDGNPADEARALVDLAELQALEGDWRGSLETAERAAGATSELVEPALEVRARNAAGDALFNLWRFEEAVAAFEQALAIAARAGDAEAEAMTLKNLGISLAALGRRDLALVRLEEATERLPGWESGALGVSVLGNLGTIYYRLGAPRSAELAYDEGLALARRRGRPDEVSDLLGRLAHLHLWTGKVERSRALFDEALASAREAGPTAELPLLEGASAAFEAVGEEAEALAALERLTAFFERQDHPVGLCRALASLASFHERRDPERAPALYRRAVGYADLAGPSCRWPALAGLARLARRAGLRDEAIVRASLAIESVEERWRWLVSEQQRRELLDRADPTYRQLVSLLVERGEAEGSPDDLEAAFAVLERSRSALLTRAIAESQLELPLELPESQRRAIRALESELLSLRRQIEASTGAGPPLDEHLERLALRERELDEHLRNARRASARGSPAASLDAGAARRLLPAGTALLSFLVDEEGSLAFLLTRDELRVVRLPARRAPLADQVEVFVELLRDGRDDGWVAVGSRLHRDLVEPWASGLGDEIETLVVVADRELRSLPFEALPLDADGRRLLVDRFAVAYVPSATALARLGSEPPGPGEEVWIFADPPAPADGAPRRRRRLRALYEEEGHDLAAIPFGRVEGRRVAARAGAAAHLLAGAEASEARAKSLPADRLGLLHFATHALLSPGDPERSALLLGADATAGEDGFLQAREIASLRLPAALVVLAACRTARGRAAGGEAIESLAESFFRAGARSVVGTLWEVEDDEALRLMSAFYEELAAGQGKAGALRAAKLAARARRAHPSEWAAFVLLGEPAQGVQLAGAPPAKRSAWWTATAVAFAAVASTLFLFGRSRI